MELTWHVTYYFDPVFSNEDNESNKNQFWAFWGEGGVQKFKNCKKLQKMVILFQFFGQIFVLSIYKTGFPPVLLIMKPLQTKITINRVVTAIGGVT